MNIFNFQEWHQNMRICTRKSLLFRKHSHENKNTNCQEWPILVCGCFKKVFYKMTSCPRRPHLSGLKSGCLIQVWLYAADLIKKLKFHWVVVSVLLEIKFGHTQIIVPRFSTLMLKTAYINPCIKLWKT